MKTCRSFFGQFKGLMFSKKKKIVFEFRKEKIIHLHMFFVFFPIYVYLLNEKKQVVEKAFLRPWTIFSSKKKAKYVVESPKKISIRMGEVYDRD